MRWSGLQQVGVSFRWFSDSVLQRGVLSGVAWKAILSNGGPASRRGSPLFVHHQTVSTPSEKAAVSFCGVRGAGVKTFSWRLGGPGVGVTERRRKPRVLEAQSLKRFLFGRLCVFRCFVCSPNCPAWLAAACLRRASLTGLRKPRVHCESRRPQQRIQKESAVLSPLWPSR